VNYFAHGRLYTHEPYFLAGTAVPDLLSVVDRRVRVRLKTVQAFKPDGDPRAAAVARGIRQHLVDDDWFHRTPAFAELSWRLTVMVRDALADDAGLRPRFLGHILVEVLLDDALIAAAPARLDAYYAALNTVDPAVVQATVNRLARNSTEKLAPLIEHFTRLRILSDYQDDEKLLARLNQIMRRVKLPELPGDFGKILPECRLLVGGRTDDLLAGEDKLEFTL
jgi:hypothetical protein